MYSIRNRDMRSIINRIVHVLLKLKTNLMLGQNDRSHKAYNVKWLIKQYGLSVEIEIVCIDN